MNIFNSSWIKIKKFFGFGKTKAEKLKEKLDKLKLNLPNTEGDLRKQLELIKALYKQQGRSELNAQKDVNDLLSALGNLKGVLDELSEIVKMDKQIKTHLFNPIRRTQFVNILLSLIIGTIGIIFKGPDFYDSIKPWLNSDEIPAYYDNLVLNNVRQSISNEDYDGALLHLDEFLINKHKKSAISQAKLYKALIHKLQNNSPSEIIIDISQIERVDNFIDAQSILLSASLQLGQKEYESCNMLLAEILGNEKYLKFHNDAKYYQIVSYLKENREDNYKIVENLINGLERKSKEISFFNFVNGKQSTLGLELKKIRNEVEEKSNTKERIEKIREVRNKFDEIKISIRYNQFLFKGEIAFDKNVLKKANRLHSELTKKFPKLNISPPKPTIGAPGYYNDVVYYRNDLGKYFFKEKMIDKISKVQGFKYLEDLKVKYSDYDLVLICSKE